MILTLQNTKETHSTVKVDGVVFDDVTLADGNPNQRVLEISGEVVDVNGHSTEIVGDLLFNFDTNEFELR